MAETGGERVTCPDCGRGYRWQSSLAGKVVPCKQCSSPFTVPNAPGVGIAEAPPPEPEATEPAGPADEGAAVGDDGTYDIAIDEPEPEAPAEPEPEAAPEAQAPAAPTIVDGKARCPSCNNAVKPEAVICLNCGFNIKQGKKIETAVIGGSDTASETDEKSDGGLTKQERLANAIAEDTHKAYMWSEYYTPLIILGAGLVLFLINALVLSPIVNDILAAKGLSLFNNRGAMVAYAFKFALTLALMFPLMLGGIFFMTSVFGSAFGNLFTAMLKLLAMVVLVIGIDQGTGLLLDWVMGGWGWFGYILRFFIVMPTVYILSAKLLEMDGNEMFVMLFLFVVGPIVGWLLAALIVSAYM